MFGVNDLGQVVGTGAYVFSSAGFLGFVTGPDASGMRFLGTLGGNESDANDINNRGQIVGYSYTASNDIHAFAKNPDVDTLQDLGTLGGRRSVAISINASGQVVGWSDSGGFQGAQHPFVASANGGGMRDLGIPVGQGYFSGAAVGINDSGLVNRPGFCRRLAAVNWQP